MLPQQQQETGSANVKGKVASLRLLGAAANYIHSLSVVACNTSIT